MAYLLHTHIIHTEQAGALVSLRTGLLILTYCLPPCTSMTQSFPPTHKHTSVLYIPNTPNPQSSCIALCTCKSTRLLVSISVIAKMDGRV